MILYTADLHFGHSGIIRFDHRPYQDVEEMDLALIELWNYRVKKEDHVYIVGDLCYRNTKPEEWYLRKLTGHKHLIVGNHDGKLLKNPKAMSYIESVDQIAEINDNGTRIILCHYPLAEWSGFHRDSVHIYAHIHNQKNEAFEFMKRKERAFNAGCMINHYAPASLRELKENNEAFVKEN